MHRFALFTVFALAPLTAGAQVVVPGRVVPPPVTPPLAPSTPATTIESAHSLLARLTAQSRVSPLQRAPWRYGQCLFGLTLPDSLGLVAGTEREAASIAAGPDWIETVLTSGLGIVPVRVVGALCADTTEWRPFFARPHAVVERGGRFAMVTLREGGMRREGYVGVRVDAPRWEQSLLLLNDSVPRRYVVGSPEQARANPAAWPPRVAEDAGIATAAPPPVRVPADPERWWESDEEVAARRADEARARRSPTVRAARRGTASERTRAASGASLSYFRGPRGGCYTYSASGRKRYVDRSLCG